MDKPKAKNYENKEWLAKELETKSVRAISKNEKVSYKLVTIWALNYGLIERTPETITA
jgi:transposase